MTTWMLVTRATGTSSCEECNSRINGWRVIGPQRLVLCFRCVPKEVLDELGAKLPEPLICPFCDEVYEPHDHPDYQGFCSMSCWEDAHDSGN